MTLILEEIALTYRLNITCALFNQDSSVISALMIIFMLKNIIQGMMILTPGLIKSGVLILFLFASYIFFQSSFP